MHLLQNECRDGSMENKIIDKTVDVKLILKYIREECKVIFSFCTYTYIIQANIII